MLRLLKRNIFIVLGMSVILILFEIFSDIKLVGLLGGSFILLILSLFISNKIINRIIFVLSLFMIVLSLILIDSIWLVIIAMSMLLILFRTPEGNEFFHAHDALILPGSRRKEYLGVQLIEVQSKQRKLIIQRSLNEMLQEEKAAIEWDDVNLVYFGGNNIIDLGNTLIPLQETTIVIRKVWGRTRIIIPNDIGLKLNCSLLSGSIIFEMQRYSLTSENFRWMSPDYAKSSRKINLIISVVFGDVEVIFS